MVETITKPDDRAQAGCPVAAADMPLSTFSLANPQTLARPNDYYAALRRQDAVYYDENLGMFLVSRYEDLQTVLRDPLTFSLEKGYNRQYAHGFHEELKGILTRDGGGYFPEAIMTDPPRHSRIRRLMEKAFTAHRVKLLEPAVASLVGGLVEKFADKGRADGMKDLATPMTIHIMCEQLGLHHVDAEKMYRWSIAYVAQLGLMQSREEMLANAREICDLQNYVIARIRERQAVRTDDMISDLIDAQLDDEENPTLNFAEIVALTRALLVGGNGTTETAIGNLLFVIATKPDVAERLHAALDDERQMARYMEEILRLEPPVRALSRVTTREVELGGKILPEGAHVLLLFASANDDESQFTCARTFDADRKNLGKHLSFGAGVHVCIGMSLARMEVRVVAREIVKRLENVRLAVPVEDIRFFPTISKRSMQSLPLTFSRRRDTA